MMSSNSSSAVLNRDGTRMAYDDGAPVLDLGVNLGVIERGDITIWKTWLRKPAAVEGAEKWEPCLVLTPTRLAARYENMTPCVVTQSDAWVYDEQVGDDLEAMIRAGMFCGALGRNPFDQRAVIRVLGIIRDLLHELLILPPRPPLAQEAVAEMVVTHEATGKVTEHEVYDERL